MTTTAETLTQGWALHQAGNHARAEQLYRRALQSDSRDANAWCYLGMACHDQDRFDEAVAAYRRAIQLQPNFPVAFNNLGNTLRLQRKLKESLASFDHALQLKPDYITAHKNKGTALVWEGHLDDAVACYRKALELAPGDAETHKNLGVIWLLQGRFVAGWREYRWRWQTSATRLPALPQPLWDGSSLDGRTILLVAEQGLGDTVHFARYGARLKERYRCRVVLACPPPLLPLLESCPGIDQVVPQDAPLLPGDVFAPLLDVPGILGDTADTFPATIPYLFADPQRVAFWKRELTSASGCQPGGGDSAQISTGCGSTALAAALPPYGGLRVGIAWQGNPQHHADRMRSIPLSAMLPLGQLAGVQLFSLQKGRGVEQLEELGGRLNVVALGERLDDTGGAFMDTAAVLQNLDLLITSDTAIAHVAGALGTPVWMALAYVPDWRWLLQRDDSPWYPTMRLFRQTAVGDWTGVFARITEELARQSPAIRPRLFTEYRLASSGMNRLVAARHGLMLYNQHDSYIGRSLELYGEFSEGEVELFQQLVRPGNVVVEAGAHVGAHTLVLSQLAGAQGTVYAFEPQRMVFQTLCANMALNSRENVHCRAEALGASPGWIVVPPLNYRQPNNFGGLALGGYQEGERVPVVTLDSWQLPRCDFVKVDVEGMEQSVLEGARETITRHRPVLYVENDRQEHSARLIEYIQSLGYDLYWHLPRMFNPANYFRHAPNEFGNVVSVNMLGVHHSVKSAIQGLRPVEGPASDWRS